MSDKGLSTESKAIYAYLCSYTGTKATAYPKVRTIIKDLNISEKRFHKHMKLLVEQGYISISREKYNDSKYMHNVYTVESNPKKYLQQPISEEEKEICDKVLMYGIQNIGYGTVSQAVMRDTRLSITAKTIYAYFCSYAGNTDTAFPTRYTALYHLNISKSTYYAHYNQLLELGYITTSSSYDSEKKHNTTTYIINDSCEFREKAETKKQSPKNVGGDFVGVKNVGGKNVPSNINIPNSTNTNINNLKHHQSGKKPSKSVQNNQNGLIVFSNKNDKENFVLIELINNKGIPQHYTKNKDLLSIAVRTLADNQNFMSSDQEHNMILDCIAEMASADPKTSKFGNMLDKFNKFIEVNNGSVSFSWLADFEKQFDSALQHCVVHNIKGYTKTSIFNFFNQYENGVFDKNNIRVDTSSFDLDEFFNKAVKIGMKKN